MKKLLFAVAVMAIALTSCGPTQVVVQNRPASPLPPQPPPDPEVTYQTFYDDLSPYGEWIDYPDYGYVWRPDVGPDFKPYSTDGHWVYSDAGWLWASDYTWGWATFHYGRWFFQDGYGWMWIPGYDWSPAWVSWRRSPDYYGWAPLGPNISVSASFGGGYNPPAHYWNFVPHQYVTSPRVNNYYVSETKNVTIINNTSVINNNVNDNNTTNNHINNTTANNTTINRGTYAGGPDPHEVEAATGAPLRPVALRSGSRPGEQNNNGQLSLFRPRVNTAPSSGAGGGNRAPGSNSATTPAPAPSKVQSFRNLRPSPNFTRPAAGANNSIPPSAPANNVPTPNNDPPVNAVPSGNPHAAGANGNGDGGRNGNANFNRTGNATLPTNNAPVHSVPPNNNLPVNNHSQPVNNPVNNNGNNAANYRPGVFPPNRPARQGKPQTQQVRSVPKNDTTRRSAKKLPPHPPKAPPTPAKQDN